jgi:hypothetical protein
MSLEHHAQDFVGETNKFVDSVKPAKWRFWLANLTVLFLHPFFTVTLDFCPLFLWISGEGCQCFPGVPLLLYLQTQCMSIHPGHLLCLGVYPSIYFYAEI